jgi:hypothetical protein
MMPYFGIALGLPAEGFPFNICPLKMGLDRYHTIVGGIAQIAPLFFEAVNVRLFYLPGAQPVTLGDEPSLLYPSLYSRRRNAELLGGFGY